MKKQIKMTVAMLVVLAIGVGCKKNNADVAEPSVTNSKAQSDGSTIHEFQLENGATMFVKEDKNGDYFLAEDITLSKSQFEAIGQKSTSTISRQASKNGSPVSSAILNKFSTSMASAIWPNGIIPYAVNYDFENSWRIDSAIAHYHQLTNVRFRLWQPGDANYILFKNHLTENNSAFGMTGGEQIVNMQSQSSVGIMIHELGHALGLFHEQTRLDRDQYVIINWDNIDPAFQYNFYKYNQTVLQNGTPVSGTDYGLFDSWSIMMYPSNAFAIDPNIPTITNLLGNTIPTQISYLSQTDVSALNYLYTP